MIAVRSYCYWHATIYTHQDGNTPLALEYARKGLDSKADDDSIVDWTERDKMQTFLNRYKKSDVVTEPTESE
jgi:hypothetical protein